MKSYSELITFDSFINRFRYLKLNGNIGSETFGSKRFINQQFYASKEWKQLRQRLILRDDGKDLGCDGYDIYSTIYIHHINPISMDDIVNRTKKLMDPENLIITTFETHNAIHYGDESLLVIEPIIRSARDTCPWKEVRF